MLYDVVSKEECLSITHSNIERNYKKESVYEQEIYLE